jgi:hypothetical protein
VDEAADDGEQCTAIVVPESVSFVGFHAIPLPAVREDPSWYVEEFKSV